MMVLRAVDTTDGGICDGSRDGSCQGTCNGSAVDLKMFHGIASVRVPETDWLWNVRKLM